MISLLSFDSPTPPFLLGSEKEAINAKMFVWSDSILMSMLLNTNSPYFSAAAVSLLHYLAWAVMSMNICWFFLRNLGLKNNLLLVQCPLVLRLLLLRSSSITHFHILMYLYICSEFDPKLFLWSIVSLVISILGLIVACINLYVEHCSSRMWCYTPFQLWFVVGISPIISCSSRAFRASE